MDALSSEQARNELTLIMRTCDKSDYLTGIELIRRGIWDKDAYIKYMLSQIAVPSYNIDGMVEEFTKLERNVKRGIPVDKTQLELFPAYYRVAILDIDFDLGQFIRSQLQFPTMHDFEKAIYESCVVKNHTPSADNWMTFALFYDGYHKGHEGWHYAVVVAIDEHVTKEEGSTDFALDLQVHLPTFSKELFPNEEAVVQNIREKAAKETYANIPIIEVKSHLTAQFAKYHKIAERIRERKKAVLKNHPLNFLDK